jgi:hypothetical protein
MVDNFWMYSRNAADELMLYPEHAMSQVMRRRRVRRLCLHAADFPKVALRLG